MYRPPVDTSAKKHGKLPSFHAVTNLEEVFVPQQKQNRLFIIENWRLFEQDHTHYSI